MDVVVVFLPCHQTQTLPTYLPLFFTPPLCPSFTSFLRFQLARTHNHTCFACGVKNENWNDCVPLVEGDNRGGAACKPPVYTHWLLGNPVLWGSNVSEVPA